MVKTIGHYNTTIEHYNWYYQQLHKRNEAKRMSNIDNDIVGAKLDTLNKINNLQRQVIEIDSSATERDLKNLNKVYTQMAQAYGILLSAVENKD